MSADVWIEFPACPTCGHSEDSATAELNVTYNLSGMLREAGFIGWGTLVGLNAQAAGKHIMGVLNGMAYDHDKWRAMNPENGWGDYDKCLQGRMRRWAEMCLEAPGTATIGGAL